MALPNQQTVDYPSFKLVIVGDGGTDMMEVKDFQIQSCFILGIILMLSFSQGLGDYVTKPYFEENETLSDSDFGIFLNNEISLGSCQMLRAKLNNEPKMLALHRNLIGEGLHRRLVSSITLESEISEHSCEAIVVERLPSGVFADPFELQHLVLRGALDDAAVFGDTNLELPSFRSNRSLVEVHMKISPGMCSGDYMQLEIKIELPLHARYQPLDLGFSRVEFGLPDVFLRCRIEENLHKQRCLLVPTDLSAKSQDDRIVWEVPCGNKDYAEIVSVVTFYCLGICFLFKLCSWQ